MPTSAPPAGAIALPDILWRAGQAAVFAAEGFFYGAIRNEHTRIAYRRGVDRFLAWCEQRGLELPRIAPGIQMPLNQPSRGATTGISRATFRCAKPNFRLGHLPNARDTLATAEDMLNRIRLTEAATSEEKFHYAERAAWLWYLKGLYAEKQGHNLDALVYYRNSVATYPPRRPRADRRDEVMQAAQQLWKQMGGTQNGWSDWAAISPLMNFYAGSGGPNAWAQLASVKPGLLLRDSQGNQWRPEDLAKKTSFVTLWASWCAPCRAELPYLEKLALRFKGRLDVAVLALTVDDDPKAMESALKELKVTVSSIAARDFAYEMLPTMAIPAAWLMTPSKTAMFMADNDALDKWLESAAQAVEKAAGN